MANQQESHYAAVYESAKQQGATDVEAHLAASQSVLESQSGQSELAREAFNFFGIKHKGATDPNQKYAKSSAEVIDGKRVNVVSDFRQYDSLDASVGDYLDFIRDRYPGVSTATTVKEAAAALQKGTYGAYATDPKYYDKVKEINATYGMPVPEQRPAYTPAGAAAKTPQATIASGQVPDMQIMPSSPIPDERPDFNPPFFANPFSRDEMANPKSNVGSRKISMDFNAHENLKASGVMIVIPDDSTDEERQAAKEYVAATKAFFESHGYKGYHAIGVKTTKENGGGKKGYFHLEPFFAADEEAVEIMRLHAEEYAKVAAETIGKVPGATFIAPHEVRAPGAINSDLGTERQFALDRLLPALEAIQYGAVTPPIGATGTATPGVGVENPYYSTRATIPGATTFGIGEKQSMDSLAKMQAAQSANATGVAGSKATIASGNKSAQKTVATILQNALNKAAISVPSTVPAAAAQKASAAQQQATAIQNTALAAALAEQDETLPPAVGMGLLGPQLMTAAASPIAGVPSQIIALNAMAQGVSPVNEPLARAPVEPVIAGRLMDVAAPSTLALLGSRGVNTRGGVPEPAPQPAAGPAGATIASGAVGTAGGPVQNTQALLPLSLAAGIGALDTATPGADHTNLASGPTAIGQAAPSVNPMDVGGRGADVASASVGLAGVGPVGGVSVAQPSVLAGTASQPMSSIAQASKGVAVAPTQAPATIAAGPAAAISAAPGVGKATQPGSIASAASATGIADSIVDPVDVPNSGLSLAQQYASYGAGKMGPAQVAPPTPSLGPITAKGTATTQQATPVVTPGARPAPAPVPAQPAPAPAPAPAGRPANAPSTISAGGARPMSWSVDPSTGIRSVPNSAGVTTQSDFKGIPDLQVSNAGIGGGPSSKYLCTLAYERGVLDDQTYALDNEFGAWIKMSDPALHRGYTVWAKPFADYLRGRGITRSVLRGIAMWMVKRWAREMAHGDDWVGLRLMKIGAPLCRFIGRFI